MRISSLSDSLRRQAARPVVRRTLGVAGWAAVAVYFAFAALVLALRYAVLPHIDDYRGEIEAAASRALRLPVSIGAIDAGWSGLRPRLALSELRIRDAAGRPALGFDNVDAEIAWSSLWHFGLRLSRLEIVAPELDLRRDAAGRFFVAGLEVTGEGGGNFPDWLLAQDRVVVRDAVVRWHDELRAAPPLVLRRVNFDLRNDGRRHRFGIAAEPPAEVAARVDLRGDFRGADPSALEAWKGEAYAELEAADLAAWRAWIDYPVELPQGSGGLRLWLSFAQLRPTGFTADLRLADVDVRLAPDLPMLQLAGVEGRFKAQRRPDGFDAEVQGLSLATRAGVRVEPTDVRLRLRQATAKRPAGGEIEGGAVDLGALAALAGHLPLDPGTRDRIAALAPSGRLLDLKAGWQGPAEALQGWRMSGRFENLGIAAEGSRPGFSGLSGTIEGDERRGLLTLASSHAALALPAVFADPHLRIDSLAAQARWQVDADGFEIHLERAGFRNADAAGEASGRYRRRHEGGAGVIDLNARLTNAAGTAVWRYMPLVVGQDARDWLKSALAGGVGDEATLRLAGDLAKFPFKDGKDGVFQVKGRVRGVTLRYAPGWPEIRGIDGELLFEGARMLIQARRGSILGVGIGPVTAEIPDLDAPEEMLKIDGRAAGATPDFLKFIEASPVGERIDHFTADMTAAGNGELRLRLDMPLRHIVETKVDGRYRFVNNRLVPDPDVPPLTEVNGEIRFSAEELEGQKIRANLFGLPLSVDVATAAEGVVVKAGGSVAVRALAQRFGHPLFDHLSGSAPWSGTVRVRKKRAELRIESNLQGIASSLPEPFNKTTNEAMPLVVERKSAPGGRDLAAVSLGEGFRMQLLRRPEGAKSVVERGVIAVGAAAPRMPERGVLLAVQARRVDADFWRRLAGADNGGEAPPVSQVDLRVDELTAFGRGISGLRLTGARTGSVWKAEIKSPEAAGSLEWDGQGAGRISGHLTHLALAEGEAGKTASAADLPRELPAVDLAVDRFSLHGKEVGALRLKAENARDGNWNARIDVRNDDAALNGAVRWRADPAPATRVEFKLAAKNVERLLVRLGYAEAVKRGSAGAEGTLTWSGGPLAPDYPSLSGRIKFEAADGQFRKLEPGVGRLLGVISLQSLPRRLTLDFRDIFSEGFAFDAIEGQLGVIGGIVELKSLQINGPAAKILMAGTLDLAAETQDLKVRVQPAIGETVATGVLLANPATGAAAWLFNKLFGNPIDRAFAYDYLVTGTWADPQVEKVAGPSGAEGGSEK